MAEEKWMNDMLPGEAGQYAELKKQTTYKASLASKDDSLESQSPIEGPKPTKSHRFYMPVVLRLPSLSAVFLTCVLLICLLQYAITTVPHSQSHANLSFLHNASSQTTSTASQVQKRVDFRSIVRFTPIQASATSHLGELVTSAPVVSNIAGLLSHLSICEVCMPGPLSFPGFGKPKRDLQTATTDDPYTGPATEPIMHPTPAVARRNIIDFGHGFGQTPPWPDMPPGPSYPDRFRTKRQLMPAETNGANPDSLNKPMLYPTSVEATYRSQSQNSAAMATQATQPHSLMARQYSKVSFTSTMTSLMSYVTVVPSTIVTTDQHAHPTTETTLVSSTVELVQALPTVVTPANEKGTDVHFPRWKVFVGEYLVILISIMFRQVWIAIHSQSKLIEPFVQLKNGAVAQDVFDSFYLSSSWIPEPIFAIMRKRWFFLLTSLAYFTVGFLGPLGLQALYLDTNYPNCPYMSINPVDPCWPPVIAVDPTATRLLQALLVFIAVVTLRIMYMVWHMQTGVYSDPSTIAGISSLVHHPAIIKDFSVEPDASLTDIMKTVGQKYYKLDDYQLPDGSWRYGIVPDTTKRTDEHQVSNGSAKFTGFRGWKTIKAISDALFILLLIGLLGVISAYYADGSNDPFNLFMSSATFGPRFMLTTFATIIAMNWKRLEKDVSTLTVYHHLAQGSAHARSTILLRKSGHPLSSMFPMLFQKHYFASFMAIIAVLSEPLIIFVGVIPYNPGRTYVETIAAIYACMTILGLMILTVIAFIIWKGRLPVIPRSPDTLAAVVSYVCDAKMLGDFEGCEYVNDDEMKRRVESLGKKYKFGKTAGMDGEIRYLVDEE